MHHHQALGGGYQQGETAADLRRQLHAMKFKDREAATFAAQASPAQRFLKSYWLTGLITGVAVFLLLYITNPLFVQESGSKSEKYAIAKPSLKRVSAWAILAALLTALGPLVYQKVSAPQ